MKQLLKNLMSVPIIGSVLKALVKQRVESEAGEISKHFINYLQPQIAHTQELRDCVFAIRHNVYCEELSFEALRENGKETDDFDQFSSFCMILHKPSGQYAGCVRLVETKNEQEKLPIEAFCYHAIENSDVKPEHFDRSKICEISRLAVKAEFRRRATDQFDGAATGAINEQTYSEIELRCFPFIAIGLYMSAAALAMENGRTNVFVMMEPRLARSMSFLGIKFKQLGPAIEYHGMRAPYYINPDIFYRNLRPGFRNLYNAINHDIGLQAAAIKADEEKNQNIETATSVPLIKQLTNLG